MVHWFKNNQWHCICLRYSKYYLNKSCSCNNSTFVDKHVTVKKRLIRLFFCCSHYPQEKLNHIWVHNCDLYILVAEILKSQFVLTVNRIHGNGRKTWSASCMYILMKSIINERMHLTVQWICVEIVSWLFSKCTSCQKNIQGMMNSSRWSSPSFLVLAGVFVSECVEGEIHAVRYGNKTVGWKQTMRVLCLAYVRDAHLSRIKLWSRQKLRYMYNRASLYKKVQWEYQDMWRDKL